MTKKLHQSFKSFNYFEALFSETEQNTVLLLDKEGIIKQVNTAFTKGFGYADDEIIGKHFRILFTEEDQKKGMPENELSNVLQKGQCMDNNYLVNKNKAITWVSGESILVKNDKGEISILKLIQDIHSQKEYELSLQSSNEFNESILSSIEDIVVVLSSEMKIIKANRAFSKLFIQVPNMEALNFSDIIKPYDSKGDLQNKILLTINTGKGFVNKEMEIQTLDGDKKVFNISCSPMEDNRNVLLV
ncbi:MAG: PAS domain-containing protein, partial [Ginsengibacter sp.]